jgi:flagellar basal-body rod protein FlgB
LFTIAGMNLAEIPLFAMLQGRLGYLSQRQKVIAQNVANADTPGYVAQDLKPFEPANPRAYALGLAMPNGARVGHMPLPRNGTALGGNFRPVKLVSSEVTLDGNAVVLEEEMMRMTDSRMNYDAAIGFYQKSMNLLRMAARPPSRG